MKTGVLWLTGLSGAGKTTLSNNVYQQLQQAGHHPILLDGDVMRTILPLYGFDENSRKEYNLIVGRLAAFLEQKGHLVIAALISPYRSIRDTIRMQCSNFYEVHVAADIDTCIKRDCKGLYKKALAGELSNFTGISSPYETPLAPDLVLDTASLSETECTEILLHFLKSHR